MTAASSASASQTRQNSDTGSHSGARAAAETGQQTLRWVEFVVTATVFGVGFLLVASPATWIPTASLVAAAAAAAALTVPLEAGSAEVLRTSSARRVTEATALAALGSLLPMMLTDSNVSPLGFIVLVALVWIALALIVAARPLTVSNTDSAAEPAGAPGSQMLIPLQRVAKRSIDIVGASLVLLLTSPLLIVTAFAIRRDGGPAMFRQQRVSGGDSATGQPDDTFSMYKFRSMVIDAEARKADIEGENERTGPIFKVSNDPRITPVGHVIRDLSIDELPQLLNVLKGDMSLVGPRPALIDEAEAFDPNFLSYRSSVKPGITGLWQAEARNDPAFDRYQSLDERYVEQWSLGLDLRILLATVVEVMSSLLAKPLKAVGITVAAGDAIIDLRDPEAVIDLRDDATAA